MMMLVNVRLASSRADLMFVLDVLARLDGKVETLACRPSVREGEHELELVCHCDQPPRDLLARLLLLDAVREATLLDLPSPGSAP